LRDPDNGGVDPGGGEEGLKEAISQ
jgi:hypothetical protein